VPALVALAVCASPHVVHAQSDGPPKEPPDQSTWIRERFKEGMDRYLAGEYERAIVVWKPVYDLLGGKLGHRIAFNLARAYDALGHLIEAGEYYEKYLHVAEEQEADRRAPSQEAIARERLAAIVQLKGRIMPVGSRPTAVRVDQGEPRMSGFVVMVEPGVHMVRFGEGAEATVQSVTVAAGELVEVHAEAGTKASTDPEPRYTTVTERPFSPALLWLTGGATALAVLVPVVTYANALSIKSDHDAADASAADRTRLAADYESARGTAYASLAVPAVLAAATAGFAIWYVTGTRKVEVPVARRTTVGASPGAISISGTF